jgi:hypothetical protein
LRLLIVSNFSIISDISCSIFVIGGIMIGVLSRQTALRSSHFGDDELDEEALDILKETINRKLIETIENREKNAWF